MINVKKQTISALRRPAILALIFCTFDNEGSNCGSNHGYAADE